MVLILLIIKTFSLQYDCSFTLSDGSTYDFASLYSQLPDYSYIGPDYTYYVNICGDTTKKC